jgi:hypothetical protein
MAGSALFGALLFLQNPPVDDPIATSLGRPEFSATQLSLERANVDPAADPEMSKMRLTNIVIEADRHIAIFGVQGAKPLVRLEGVTVNDWHLDSIAPRVVTLTGPAGTTTLEPKADPNLAWPVAAGNRPLFPTPPMPQPKAAASPPVRLPNVPANPTRPANPARPPQ